MDALLTKLSRQELSGSDEASLYRAHDRHFSRRVWPLPPIFFPGGEKNEDAIRSLSAGAYASFRGDPTHDGEPAFCYTVSRGLDAKGFLYYWRTSATIQFLRREGSGALRRHFNLRRAVHQHLRGGFTRVGTLNGGDALWWLASGEVPARTARGPDLAHTSADLGDKRGKAVVRAVLEAHGVPLTHSEIVAIVEHVRGERPPIPEGLDQHEPVADDDSAEAGLIDREVRARAERFFSSLTAQERALLQARGYGVEGRPRRSFREVAEIMPERSGEHWRLSERQVLRSFAEVFPELDEAKVAATLLVQRLTEVGHEHD